MPYTTSHVPMEILEARLLLDGEITLALDQPTIVESGSVTVTGTLAAAVTEPSTLQLNWGDGSAITTVDLLVGATSFTASHTYAAEPAQGEGYTITAALGTWTASTTVTVANAAPEILTLSFDPAKVNENEFTLLQGTFADAGLADSHTLTIDWGDGQTQTLSLQAGAREFAASHQYLDDGASGTASDTYTATVTLSDGAAADSQAAEVVVDNVAPAVYELSIDPVVIDENGTGTLSGKFTDPGTLDTHTVVISWGDGSEQTLTLAVGQREFTATHQYLDDAPTGTPSDVFTVNVSVTDDDTGVGLAATTVTVNNVAPTITDLTIDPVVIDENGSATLVGTFTDPGTLDTHTVTIVWGDGSEETISLELGVREFTATHQYLDDAPSGTPSDVYTVNVTVTDDDTGAGVSATTITVNNVAPVITQITSSASTIGSAAEGDTITISGLFTDVGTLDTHTAVIDWGDGTSSDAIIGQQAGGGSFSGTHVYTAGGVYGITVTVTDDDTGAGTADAAAVITGVGIHDGVLQIIGSTQADRVHVNTFRGGKMVRVHASFLEGGKRDLDFASVTRIETLLGEGADTYTMAGNLRTLAFVDGGAGDDTLSIGATTGVVVGGEGNDRIKGGHGKAGGSLLIGGAGTDTITSHVRSSDIVVGGWTTLDPNQAAIQPDFSAALLDALAKWSTGGKTAAQAQLQLGTTVLDDGATDRILGGKSGKVADWVVDEILPVTGKGKPAAAAPATKVTGPAKQETKEHKPAVTAPTTTSATATTVQPASSTAVIVSVAAVQKPGRGNGQGSTNAQGPKAPVVTDVLSEALPVTIDVHGKGNGKGNGKK